MMMFSAWAMGLVLATTPTGQMGGSAAKPAGAPLPKLRVEGANLVDPQGRVVKLDGVNLGNWFVLEMWMMSLTEGDLAIRDQFEFENILVDRFGNATRERLMNEFRRNWIQDQDFEIIRSFGFNAVRLPLNYRQFEDDARPMQLRSDAWTWVDRAVAMAGRHQLYVILDLHGVQGGQSVFDHTGHAGQNKLWTSTENRRRLAWLWGELAKRFRNNPTVAAYDVINEPFGGTHEQQLSVFKEVYPAIRAVDPDKLIYIPGHTDGFAHYGDPKQQGWRNVGFTMHYYPGLFGNGNPTVLTHAKHLRSLEATADRLRKLKVPFLVGEMNVVFNAAGGADMMRRTYDVHRQHGWSTTMWSYRVSSTNGGHGDASWGMVTNPGPVQRIDLRRASLAEIEAWIQHFGTDRREVNEPLRRRMTEMNPQLPPLPELPPVLTVAPSNVRVPGWTATDVGGARPGGQRPVGEDGVDLWGQGADIWGGRDQFRFLHQAVEGDFTLAATVEDLKEVGSYTKGGLMVRSSTDPSAAALLLSTFPNGILQLAFRPTDGGAMNSRADGVATWPKAELRIQRRGSTWIGATRVNGTWVEVGRVTWDAPGRVQVGLVAGSNDAAALTEARYRGIRLSRP